jgi:hypothetical protein
MPLPRRTARVLPQWRGEALAIDPATVILGTISAKNARSLRTALKAGR